MALARVSETGDIEATYGAMEPGPFHGTSDYWRAKAFHVALDLNGRIVMAGELSTDTQYMGIGRRLPDGTPDPNFGAGGAIPTQSARTNAFHVLRDGRYVVAGYGFGGTGLIVRVWD